MKSQISILALFLLFTGCGNGNGDENGDNGNKKITPVYVTELQPQTFRHYVTVQGDVESDKTIMVTPRTSATVEEIFVKAGDEVKKGDVLARLDGKITKSQLQQVKTQLELAKTLYERQKNLREQNIGSEVEFLQAKTQYESAKSQLVSLEEQYSFYTIRANISGTVDRVDLKVGEMVSPQIPVFQISNSEALKVTAQVSEAYITRISNEDSVQIVFPSLGETVTKRLDVVRKAINPSNRTFGVEVALPNGINGIRPNMMARVKINDITLQNQIVVPLNAVQIANKVNYVFVAQETENGWVAKYREVQPGFSYDNDMVITDGLKAGDILITTGYANLTDGAVISIQEN